jgi:type IV pilus assembly protein PilF
LTRKPSLVSVRVAVAYKYPNLLAFLVTGSLAFTAACGPTGGDLQRSQNRLDLAKDLLSKGEVTGAESETRKAIGFDPKNEEAHNLLGLVYVFRAHQSTQLLEKTDCLEGKDAEMIRGEADGHMRAADKHFAQAVELAKDYGEAMQNRAVVAMYFHDWEKAVELEQQALAHMDRLDSVPLARANLGWAYYNKQDYVHATTELLQANQVPQFFCLGKYRLAQVYFARKDFQQAKLTLERMIDDPKLCPPIQEALYLGGETYLRLRDTRSAAKAFGMCVTAAPISCHARACNKALSEIAPEQPTP